MERLQRPSSPRERLIVALDFSDPEDAVVMVRNLGEEILWVKVGLELFCAGGPAVVESLSSLGKRIFLDLKFHDIPNTVSGAVRAAARLPVHLMNLHASAGKPTMRAAQEAIEDRPDLGLLAVTRLTSDAREGVDFADVEFLASEAAEVGLFGVVTPAAAAPRLRHRMGERLALICPGIRPAGVDSNDQVHVATPAGAVEAGADWIVVGRAITRAVDPRAAARRILDSIVSTGG